MSDDLHRQFESLSHQVDGARKKCEETYRIWKLATREFNLLERQQSEIFRKMAERSVTVGLPKAQKTL